MKPCYRTAPVTAGYSPAEAIAMAMIRGASTHPMGGDAVDYPGKDVIGKIRQWADSWVTYRDGSVLYVGESVCHDGTSETLYLCVEAPFSRHKMDPMDRARLVRDMPRRPDDDKARILQIAADLALAKA